MNSIVNSILIFELLFQLTAAQQPIVVSNTARPRLPSFCRQSYQMNRISRSFLCHLLPAMNIQLVWDNKNKKDFVFTTNPMQSQTIGDNINEFNTESDFKENIFPFETQMHYSFVPNYGIPLRLPLIRDNIFEHKVPNDMETIGFGDLAHINFNDQMEEPLLDSSETNRLIESPLLLDSDVILKHNSSNQNEDKPYTFLHYFEDFSRNNRKYKSISDSNDWKPINKISESHSKTIINKQKTTQKPTQYISVQPQPQPQPLEPYLSYNMTYNTMSTTSSPIITIPSYIRRKHLIDLSLNVEKITNNKIKQNIGNLRKKAQNMKTPTKIPSIRDWSLKMLKNSSDWMPSNNFQTINKNKPQNEMNVKTFGTNYTKSSVIFSIEEKILKNQINGNRIGSVPIKIKNHTSFELRGKPGIDYPIHSSSATSNFTCNGQGFFADTDFDCQVYHHCEDGYHQKFICPNGTLFNVSVQSCDYWFNVKCERNSDKNILNHKIDEKTQNQTNSKIEDSLKDYSKDKIIEDLKLFVESVSKVKNN